VKEPKRQGLVQVNTGNGKGKTTAALGTILRAAGYGLKVFVIFFMKGHYEYGEYKSLPGLPNVTVAGYGLRKLSKPGRENPEEKREAEAALAKAREVVMSGRYDVVLLDEINVAVDYGLIGLEDVLELVKNRPSHVELILTGRYADNRLLELADQVTEMVKVKHPFDAGINARKGIDY
jgi:cob(I)alamin adenosyltransferase